MLALALHFIFFAKGYFLSEQLGEVLIEVTGLYAAYLTPIIAFWYSKRKVALQAQSTNASLVVAAVCSAIFNIVLLVVFVFLFWAEPAEGVLLKPA